jgi:DNA sulfur modification protein DndC
MSRITQSVAQSVLPYIDDELHDGRRLDALIEGAQRACREMIQRGRTRWYVMYSGGKDSTAALVLTLEALKDTDASVEVLYCDTQLEIPTLYQFAQEFLGFLATQGVKTTVLTPDPEESFWVQVIGKGYPMPHNGFRWCTARLKVRPVERYLKTLAQQESQGLVVTGVRFGESDARDLRLNLSCSRGGECGQGVWFEESGRLGLGYFSPVAIWRECDVWDFLTFVAPDWGYPTGGLNTVYQGRETRFGCWTCSVVSQDRTMQRIVAVQPEWRPLLELRDWLVAFSRTPDNRVRRPNGMLGRLTMAARAEILRRVQATERATGMSILSEGEMALIHTLWASGKYGDGYDFGG